MLDRIDVYIEVSRVDHEKLSGDRMRETSDSIRKRVQAARNIQQQHFASSQSDTICNTDMRVGEIRQFCQLQLSARAYHRILKLARTIADSQRVRRSSPRIWQRRCNIDQTS